MKAIPKHQMRGASAFAGYFVVGAVAAADIILEGELVLIPLFVVAPLVASVRATPKQTFRVAVVAVMAAVVFGWLDDIWGTRRHTVAIATTLLGGLLAIWSAAARGARDSELATSLPVLRAADRLKISLTTGRMGEWTWASASGKVTWDANVTALFGVEDGQFDGTFEAWIRLIDERDRVFVQNTVNGALDARTPFRFDHRCTWPDGSTHWIEGIGDVTIDPKTDRVTGAFGLAVDVDERHRQVEERTHLLALELRLRQRGEYLASINSVASLSVDVDRVVQTMTALAIPELADWCSIVVAIDRPRSRPSIAVAHRDPGKMQWAEQLQRDYTYNPDARWGAAEVIRTGKPEIVREIDPRLLARLNSDILTNADLGSVITLPLVGALGTLGAMQWIRGAHAMPFSEADQDLANEVAIIVGTALNNAVLFQRQTRSRTALATLQTVSGLIASVATTDEVVRATLVEGGRGLGATSGSLFLINADDVLVARERVGLADQVRRDAERHMARQAVDSGELASFTVATDGGDRFVVGVPMQALTRMVGALAFTFDDQREPTPEELLMLVTLGSRCAGALERATLYERERTIALTLQHRLLSTIRTMPGWIEVAASYVPATGLEIGGDWFQVLEAGEGRLAAVVGDAVGHGLASAAAMGQLRASFATAVLMDPDPMSALEAVDRFAELGADTMAASAAFVLVDQTGFARYASAGHPPIVVARAAEPARVIEGARGGLLGYRTAASESVTFPFEHGDMIVMYTDGLVETRTGPIDDGIARLVAAVDATRHLPAHEMCEVLVATLTEGRDVDDDIATLVLRRM